MLGSTIRVRRQSGLFVVLVVAALGQAQTTSDQPTITQLVQQINQLQQQDLELQERIRILEAKQQQGPREVDNASAPSPLLPAEQTQPPQVPSAAPFDWHDVRGLQWRGFGEANYKVLNQRRP